MHGGMVKVHELMAFLKAESALRDQALLQAEVDGGVVTIQLLDLMDVWERARKAWWDAGCPMPVVDGTIAAQTEAQRDFKRRLDELNAEWTREQHHMRKKP